MYQSYFRFLLELNKLFLIQVTLVATLVMSGFVSVFKFLVLFRKFIVKNIHVELSDLQSLRFSIA